MATITSLNANDNGADSRGVINTNFTNLNDDKIESVAGDTTPQLGGNLDVNGKVINSVSDGDIVITPNGTGDVILDGLKYPQADGGANEVLITDGGAQLSFAAVTGLVTAASDSAAGKVELATIAETDTGTDAARAVTPDGLQGSKRNIRYLVFTLIDADTSLATDTTVGGDFTIPFAGTILQSDTLKDQLAATTDTAGITGTMVVDIHLDGTTIMDTNKLDIETTEKGTQDATTQPDLSTTSISAGGILTFDVDAVHSGTAAKGLKVYMAILED